jgi:DNA invertase Pin-like site-specific DNA recombinase
MGNYNFKGENNNHSKLTDKQVNEIFKAVEAKTSSYRKIGAEYSVSHSQVYKIYNGKTRTYLDLHKSKKHI